MSKFEVTVKVQNFLESMNVCQSIMFSTTDDFAAKPVWCIITTLVLTTPSANKMDIIIICMCCDNNTLMALYTKWT